MPITQDRLIKLINITERAINVTKIHKQAAQRFSDAFAEQIHDKLSLNDREIVRSFITSFANTILEHQMSVEDFMDFREEQLHFKFTQKRNNANRKYQQRHRARVRMHDDVRQEEILYAEEYAALNAAKIGNPESEDQEINFIDTPALESDPDYDPSKRGEVIRDEQGVGNKPIRGIVSKSEDK